jgi:D-alanyl-D-alanine carboxypeptidase
MLAICAPAYAEGLADAPPVHDALAAIDRDVRSAMQAQSIPGLEIAIVHDRALLWSSAYGTADLARGEKVSESTRFVVGSVSKLLTAIAVVQLRDAGKLDLDEPVTRALPWFRLAGEPHPAITVRELLIQFGGLPREAPGGSWQRRAMPDRETLIRSLTDTPPALPPETEWKYSNLGYAVLGLVVESASGENYADYFRDHVAKPLHMDRTVATPLPPADDIATGYSAPSGSTREARPPLATGGVAPAAGIASTARDMAQLLLWMLDDGDGPVMSAQSRREMLRVQAMTEDWSVGQGLGFEQRRVGSAIRIGHAGRAGGYAARIEVDPATRIGMAILTNADDASPTRIIDRAMATLAPALATASPPPAPPQPDPAWQEFTGTYVSSEGRDSAVAIVEGRLAWVDPADPHVHTFLDPAGPDRFRFASGNLVGEILTFERDAAGHVAAMSAAGATDRRK